MAFGDVIRYATSPSENPTGIGGEADTIWHCDRHVNKVYELSVSDLSVVRSANSPGTLPIGIGGTSSKIWHCDVVEGKVYELSISDFSVVRSAAPTIDQDGIGGGDDVIWHLAWKENAEFHYDLDELSVSDLSIVRTGSPPTEGYCKVGGKADVIWACSYDSEKVYELLVTDFSVDRSVDSPYNNPTGIGGDSNTIWHNNRGAPTPDQVMELDAGAPPPTPQPIISLIG